MRTVADRIHEARGRAMAQGGAVILVLTPRISNLKIVDMKVYDRIFADPTTPTRNVPEARCGFSTLDLSATDATRTGKEAPGGYTPSRWLDELTATIPGGAPTQSLLLCITPSGRIYKQSTFTPLVVTFEPLVYVRGEPPEAILRIDATFKLRRTLRLLPSGGTEIVTEEIP
jgi:hypothetical protein